MFVTLCVVNNRRMFSIKHNNYYPELQDIRNHINKAERIIQLSVLDQENVALKVEQWKKELPIANYLFRLFNKSSSESNAEVPEQSLLWVHQEVWQQDLLLQYVTRLP